MTAEQAFKQLIENKEYISTLTIDGRNELASYKSMWKQKKIKNLGTILEKHGYIKVQDPIWEHKNKVKWTRLNIQSTRS